MGINNNMSTSFNTVTHARVGLAGLRATQNNYEIAEDEYTLIEQSLVLVIFTMLVIIVMFISSVKLTLNPQLRTPLYKGLIIPPHWCPS